MATALQRIIIISALAVLTVRGDECSFGRPDLSPTKPNATPGLFIDREHPAPCSGQITHWRVCYYNSQNFDMGDTLKILLQTWHFKKKHRGSRISSYATSLLIPKEQFDYQCVNITVEPADYIAVEEGHYIAVFIFNNSMLPIVAHTAYRSRLFHLPYGASIPDTIGPLTADILSNQAIHVSATIVTASSKATPHNTFPTMMQFQGTSASSPTNPQSTQGSRGAIVGAVLVILVAIAVTVIIVVTVILVKRRSIPVVSIKKGPDNIYSEEAHEYQEMQFKEASSNYEVPVPSEAASNYKVSVSSEAASNYEVPVPSEVASNYEVPVPIKAAASKQPEHICANIFPAYGINTTIPHLELGREGQEDVKGTPSDGELLTSGPNKMSVSAVSTREDTPTHNTGDIYEYVEMDPMNHSVYIEMQPMDSNEYVEMESVKQCDYVEMQPAILPEVRTITSSPNHGLREGQEGVTRTP